MSLHFAANCRPQPRGKSCPAPSMFLWFAESAYRCPGASPATSTWQAPGPSAVSIELDCFWLSRHTEWSLQNSKLDAGQQKSSKASSLPISLTFVVGTLKVSGVLPRLCKVFTWADPPTFHTVLCFPTQAQSPWRWSQDRCRMTHSRLRASAASHPKVLSYSQVCSQDYLFP